MRQDAIKRLVRAQMPTTRKVMLLRSNVAGLWVADGPSQAVTPGAQTRVGRMAGRAILLALKA